MKNLKADTIAYLTAYELGMDKESIKQSFANHVEYTLGRDGYSLTLDDCVQSLIHTARDRLYDRWNQTQQSYYNEDQKRVYYLSMEFLIGRLLESSLSNLGILEPTRQAMAELGIDMEEVIDQEWEPGLGNGGLGRLAACFLDSMATLGIPAIGFGLRYEYGIFRQALMDGQQIEHPDNWLRYGYAWENARNSRLFPVHFNGHVLQHKDANGRLISQWVDTEDVMALGFDILVPGYRNEVVNTLRLWSAKASREFDLSYFNHGDYIQAVHDKNVTENITRVLYPNDTQLSGRELRLKQEYFLVAASLQDALTRHLKGHGDLEQLPQHAVFQLNDTHPTMAIPEMMRILLDQYSMNWDEAWRITTHCFAYTNHTIMPEALERWPVALIERVLPRHMQIIYEINHRLLDEVRRLFPDDEGRIQRMSLIEEGPVRQVRMANLAIAGSFSVNGVSALHSRLIRDELFADFSQATPGKFNNKTNGITPRRWLLQCNPELSRLISSKIGEDWVTDLYRLKELETWADDAAFQAEWREVKKRKKQQLARWVARELDVRLDTDSVFDVQVKRLHEYKRQLLNLMQIISLYQDIRSGAAPHPVPQTYIFAGKAAPAYDIAKRIIRLINQVGLTIAADPKVRDLLRVVFLPNYNVTMAQRIIPAADVSEQISTAGTEASGTSNMKFALNGALTVGTLDGANIEILEAVGPGNLFTFGLTAEGVQALRHNGYRPRDHYEADPALKQVLDSIQAGDYCAGGSEWVQPIVSSLLDYGDTYMLLADFDSYRRCKQHVQDAYRDPARWTRSSILNVANMGRFSSDSTILQYATEIWNATVKGNGAKGGGSKDGGSKDGGSKDGGSKGGR